MVDYSRQEFKISLRQACILFHISSSVYYYKAKRKDDDEVIGELSRLAELHSTWGFWMMYHRLRNLKYMWNHKRVYRVYCLMRLNMRNKRKKRLPRRVKEPLLCPVCPNVTWSLDFMHDTLENGKSVRTLNVIDDFSREVLSISVDTSMPAARVIRELEQLMDWRGRPERIRSDNGPEFIASAMKEWCEKKDVDWLYIQPGKPTQNSLVERFNRTFRQDVLDRFIFTSVGEMRKYAQGWAWIYNNERPHAALGYMTPVDFLLKYGKPPAREGHRRFPTLQQDNNNNFDKESLILNVAS